MIRNIQLNHGGKYVCVIDTEVESLSTSAILVVKGKTATRFALFVFIRQHMNNLVYLLQNSGGSVESLKVKDI